MRKSPGELLKNSSADPQPKAIKSESLHEGWHYLFVLKLLKEFLLIVSQYGRGPWSCLLFFFFFIKEVFTAGQWYSGAHL